MFNRKLKQKIASLEEEIFSNKLHFEKRIWKLENPSKYKVGDKIEKDIIVVEVLLRTHFFTPNGWLPYFMQSPNKDSVITYYWEYKTINTKTREVSIL